VRLGHLQFSTRAAVIGGVLLGLSAGLLAGVGGFTFIYAKGFSYMTNDPMSCANCHVMQGHLDAWRKGSHHAVATCNDCHTPHDFVGKWLTKSLNGYHHSLAFTTGKFHEPIQITARNESVTEQTCRHCHADIVNQIDFHASGTGRDMSCIRCHAGVGHME
jgi:cytochrome c nitrite reductase small subunit